MDNLRSCYGCRHFDGGVYDTDTGYTAPESCGFAAALVDGGECTEAVGMTFEAILFQLSVLNNCPKREAIPARTIAPINRKQEV